MPNSDFAINYANIGAIFEGENKLDSAWAYYRKSMEMNIEACPNALLSSLSPANAFRKTESAVTLSPILRLMFPIPLREITRFFFDE